MVQEYIDSTPTNCRHREDSRLFKPIAQRVSSTLQPNTYRMSRVCLGR